MCPTLQSLLAAKHTLCHRCTCEGLRTHEETPHCMWPEHRAQPCPAQTFARSQLMLAISGSELLSSPHGWQPCHVAICFADFSCKATFGLQKIEWKHKFSSLNGVFPVINTLFWCGAFLQSIDWLLKVYISLTLGVQLCNIVSDTILSLF